MTDIIRHPSDWTPEGLLKESLREVDDVESIIILVKYKDGEYGRVWSKQGIKELSFKKELLEQAVRRILDDGERE